MVWPVLAHSPSSCCFGFGGLPFDLMAPASLALADRVGWHEGLRLHSARSKPMSGGDKKRRVVLVCPILCPAPHANVHQVAYWPLFSAALTLA